ncbi:hypothetical protein EP20_001015 [Staphylococcus aureus]|uniref:thiolase family protein n=1 Tax=Staphylococcus aureus TaxID=1280 RepID=UPI000705D192|nr:hypothetical protein [Staphylococcus aureus]ALK40726.1 hypothetical protein EP20_001015 [Staphylococcus aureus]
MYGVQPQRKQSKAHYSTKEPDDVGSHKVLQGVLKRIDGKFNKNMIEDVIGWYGFPEGLQGKNIARTIALRAGLSDTVPGQTVNRYLLIRITNHRDCSQSNYGCQGDILVAVGVELMSAVPMVCNEPHKQSNLNNMMI